MTTTEIILHSPIKNVWCGSESLGSEKIVELTFEDGVMLQLTRNDLDEIIQLYKIEKERVRRR